MTTSLTEANLERKFQNVTNTQDSIQTLSLWLLHHRAHHRKIVTTWMKVLKKAKISHRLTLFYLANDVIQNSKRKGIPFFKDSFAEVLREATLFVRDEQIKNSVNRVFNIWNDRNIYDSDFISDLQGILANAKVPASAPLKVLAEFKCEKVIDKLKAVAKLERETSTKAATLNLSKLNATNSEIVQKLKDRTHGQQFSHEFEESVKCLEELIKALNKEIQERNELIILLEQSEIYYDTQRGEAKIVSNAYKNFATRVKSVQKKLEEILPTFASPIPSPTPDAPSPTNSDVEAELELPGEKTPVDGSEEGKEGLASDLPETSVPATVNAIPSVPSTAGNPIPTLSSLFSQESSSSVPAWLTTLKSTVSPLATSIAPPTAPAAGDNSSLDSRLSSLLQNIPNLPSGLQNTLLGASMSDSNASSPTSFRRSNASGTTAFAASDSNTAVKEECSGQNTPLQDEDTTSSNATSFFNRLSATPKSGHNPKEILKGLTSLIQSASSVSKDKSYKVPDKSNRISVKPETDEAPKTGSVSDNVSSLVARVTTSSTSSSPPPPPPSSMFFASSSVADTASSRSSFAPLSDFVVPPAQTQVPVYTTPTTESTNAQNIQENLSYIPTIVPSTPTTSHFKFQPGSSFQEYDPSMNVKPEDADSVGNQSNPTPVSEDNSLSPSSPDEMLSGDELADTVKAARQSTLITLVNDSSEAVASLGEKKDVAISAPATTSPQVTQSGWPIPLSQAPGIPANSIAASETSKMEPVFAISGAALTKNGCMSADILSLPPPPTIPATEVTYPWPPSKIETVHSYRNYDNRWLGGDSGNFVPEPHPRILPSELKPFSQGPVEYHNYHHQSQPPTVGRNSWRGRERPFSSYRGGGGGGGGGPIPVRKNFSPFPPRGRGRRWHPPTPY